MTAPQDSAVHPDASAEPPGPSGPRSLHLADPDPAQLTAVVDEPHLSVAAAARRLGIAPGTLRTWDRRYGIGPSEHTSGRHRRYSPDDVARLELMHHALVRGATPADAARHAMAAHLPRPDTEPSEEPAAMLHVAGLPDLEHPGNLETSGGPAGADAVGVQDSPPVGTRAMDEVREQSRTGGQVLRLPGAGRRARGLGRAALALDAGAARRILTEAIAVSGVQATWDDVARPVLSAVAQRWTDTGGGIETEHLLSDIMIGVFSAIAATAPRALETRPVLLAGMPGELHILPVVVLAAALAQRRVPCRSLGADLPAPALVAAIRRTAPVAVVLWSQQSPTADSGMLRTLPRTRPQVRMFAAGPGWAGVDLPPRVIWLETLAAATDAISAAATL